MRAACFSGWPITTHSRPSSLFSRDSKKRYRADVLIEDQIAKYEEKIEKEVAKARKRFGDAFDEADYWYDYDEFVKYVKG